METLMTLKEHRQKAGLTQAQLAQQAFVSPSTIAHWEQHRGTPFLTEFRRVCVALDIPMEKVALSPYERLFTTHNLTYHLQAQRDDDEAWRATVLQADASQLKLAPGMHPSQRGLLPGSMDPNDPELNSAYIPLTYKWAETGQTPDEAFEKLKERIANALERALSQPAFT
jgi:transcriptional regulator with XRE-family HTH domain